MTESFMITLLQIYCKCESEKELGKPVSVWWSYVKKLVAYISDCILSYYKNVYIIYFSRYSSFFALHFASKFAISSCLIFHETEKLYMHLITRLGIIYSDSGLLGTKGCGRSKIYPLTQWSQSNYTVRVNMLRFPLFERWAHNATWCRIP